MGPWRPVRERYIALSVTKKLDYWSMNNIEVDTSTGLLLHGIKLKPKVVYKEMYKTGLKIYIIGFIFEINTPEYVE